VGAGGDTIGGVVDKRINGVCNETTCLVLAWSSVGVGTISSGGGRNEKVTDKDGVTSGGVLVGSVVPNIPDVNNICNDEVGLSSSLSRSSLSLSLSVIVVESDSSGV